MVKFFYIFILTQTLNATLLLNKTQMHFFNAIKNNQERVISKLLKRMDNFDFYDKKRNSPLHYAVIQNNKKLVLQLLQKGAHPNVYNRHGYTPLHLAVQHNHLTIVKILLYFRAETDVKDNAGYTPIYYAKELKNYRIFDLLTLFSKKKKHFAVDEFDNFIKNFDVDAINTID